MKIRSYFVWRENERTLFRCYESSLRYLTKNGETLWRGERHNEGLEVAKAANAKVRSEKEERVKAMRTEKERAKEYMRTPLFND